MKIASPLRYPGGKSTMSDLLSQIRSLNRLGDRSIAEPFAGGAGASLKLLYLEETHEIYINDADLAIHDFWWTIINRPNSFVDMLKRTRVSMAEWNRQREVYKNCGRVSRLHRGFSAFYLNRCNRSGIIDGGPIGGHGQKGKWKLNARFNKSALRQRCEKVAEYRDRINVSCRDGIEFIKSLDTKSTFFFIDPPYFAKGKTLYLNVLNEEYHFALATLLRSMTDIPWVLTYDDCPEIRQIYKDWARIRPFSLQYAANERRKGKEIFISPKWLRLPTSQSSLAISW